MIDDAGLIIGSWGTLGECAKDLGISTSGVQQRLKYSTKFVFENKTGFLKRITSEDDPS